MNKPFSMGMNIPLGMVQPFNIDQLMLPEGKPKLNFPFLLHKD
jgi:hypothetical protein